MKNYYPELPTIPYQNTPIEMAAAIDAIQKLQVPAEVKRSTYVVFRNESGNGKKGFNNNFGGIQTDSARWPKEYDNLIIGNVKVRENGTGDVRLFAAFGHPFTFFEMLSDRLGKRGIYVGGTTYLVTKQHVNTPEELAEIYKKEWVTGKASAVPSDLEKSNFLSMYKQAAKIFV